MWALFIILGVWWSKCLGRGVGVQNIAHLHPLFFVPLRHAVSAKRDVQHLSVQWPCAERSAPRAIRQTGCGAPISAMALHYALYAMRSALYAPR